MDKDVRASNIGAVTGVCIVCAAALLMASTGAFHAGTHHGAHRRPASIKPAGASKPVAASSSPQRPASGEQQPAQLAEAIKQHKQKSEADRKTIRELLVQSDASFERARQYKQLLPKAKDKKQAQLLQQKLTEAQDAADAGAAQAVSAEQDLNAQFDAIADLQKQIDALSAKEGASKDASALLE